MLPDWLAARAASLPGQAAVLCGDLHWTFADLDAQATALARHLAAAGAGPGMRVAALLRNGPHFVAAVHALTRLGSVLVPLNLRLSRAELGWQLADAAPGLLLHDPATAGQAAEAASDLPGLALLALDPLAPARRPGERAPDHSADGRPHHAAACTPSGQPPLVPGAVSGHGAQLRPEPGLRTHIDLSAVQCIMYTSGTTGRPKGALLSYGNHWWSAIASVLNLGLAANDRWLACLPLFHIGGLSILLRSVIYGIPVVFPDPPGGPFDPQAIRRAMDGHGATIISVVSAQLQRLLDGDPAAGQERQVASSLRCVLLGGGPAPRPLLEECARRGLPVVQSYGLTEAASQVATLPPAEALRKLGAAGRPLLPTELRILPLAAPEQDRQARSSPRAGPDAAADPRSAEAGEILVRGPTVTPGYFAGADHPPSPAVDAEGWLHTGDIGYLDAEGFLYVLDRRTDLIISGGENVYPAEVEAVLLGYPAVAEAAVYGRPDPRWGQVVAAAIVPRDATSIDPEELLAYCRARLAGYKVPAQLRLVTALPRNGAGKVLRRTLQQEPPGSNL